MQSLRNVFALSFVLLRFVLAQPSTGAISGRVVSEEGSARLPLVKPTVDAGGRFTDNLSIGGFFGGAFAPGTANQVFYATADTGAQSQGIGFVAQSLVIDFYGTDYSILGLYEAATTVLVNNKAAPGGCK